MHVPAQGGGDDQNARQVGFAVEEQRDVRIALRRKIVGNAGEQARIDLRVDDIALVVGEQELAGQPAAKRRTTDCW